MNCSNTEKMPELGELRAVRFVLFVNGGREDEFLWKNALDRLGDKYLSGGRADKILQKRLADREKDTHKRRT